MCSTGWEQVPGRPLSGIHPLLDTVNGAGWGEGHMTQSEPMGRFLRIHIGPLDLLLERNCLKIEKGQLRNALTLWIFPLDCSVT